MASTVAEGKSAAVLNSVRIGVVSGLCACCIYPILTLVRLPRPATALLGACFGPALALGSFGIWQCLDTPQRRIAGFVGFLMNSLAGCLFTTMVLVQMAIGYAAGAAKLPPSMVAIWLGLDVAWDAYICAGTIAFCLAMFHHPRFGRVFAVSGIVIATGLMALHCWTFPTPPQKAGLFDLGPAVGLWYLVVTVQMARSLPWLRHNTAL